MNAKLLRNIDLVQINIQAGVSEYYFPKNVDWNGQVVDKLLLVAPSADMLSPIDGTTPVLKASEVQNMYVDLYTVENRDLTHSLSHEQILYTNDHPYKPGVKLSLELSRIYFTEEPQQDGCLLLYVFWGGRDVECVEQSQRNITVEFDLAANQQISFRDLINTYAHVYGDKIRAISVWNAEDAPVYLTLRDYQLSYIMRDVCSVLFRPLTMGATAADCQVEHAYLDSIDIDFDYSYIRNACNEACTQRITFEY